MSAALSVCKSYMDVQPEVIRVIGQIGVRMGKVYGHNSQRLSGHAPSLNFSHFEDHKVVFENNLDGLNIYGPNMGI